MNELKKAKDVIKKLTYILSKKQKKYAIIILVMSGIAALLETLGVAVIMPVLDMMLDIDGIRNRWYMDYCVKAFRLDTNGKVVWFICIGVILVYLFKNLYFTFYSWISCKYSYMVQKELGVRVLSAYMKQGYLFFVENNTARLINGITSDAASIYGILKTIFTLVMKVLSITCIAIYIMLQSPYMAVLLLGLSLVCLVVVHVLFRKSMSVNGAIRRELMCDGNKVAMEAIQGSKEILVTNKQTYFVKMYSYIRTKYNEVSVKVDMGTTVPAYIIEMICIVGVVITLGIQIGTTSNVYGLVTKLSTVAAGAFRILPALGAITSGINTIIMSTSQLGACYETMQQVKDIEKLERTDEEQGEKKTNVHFQSELRMNHISFQYPKTKDVVLEGVNLSIKKGESIAFIGPSGAGKTTISDIILGLLKPVEGQVFMDGINIENLGADWNRIIGYVPQNPYIMDDTIQHNIAFGEKNINEAKIWQALEIAQLDSFVKELPNGVNTRVGERGVRFSGGQRQRLAIARAVYRNPDILVLDEATAALDKETEAEVMKAIEALQGYKTLIIVAHRLTTVRKCDTIYEVKDKRIYPKSKEEVFEEDEKRGKFSD